MDEFGLINRFFKHKTDSSDVVLGIGDDCAVIRVPENHELAFSIDTLLADVHFFAGANPEWIAARALCVSLSDLAAMGAEPRCFTLSLTIPEADAVWLGKFSTGLLNTAEKYGCALVGGDTVKGALSISIQVHGFLPQGQGMTRRGASSGDVVYVSGCVGDGAAALHALSEDCALSDEGYDYFHRRYYHPEPQISLGKHLRAVASSCIDVSDGLLADLGHICAASGVGACINLEGLPVSAHASALLNGDRLTEAALSGGDDYQLCFTVPEDKKQRFHSLVASENLDVTAIGTITSEEGIRCQKTGRELTTKGYLHFGGQS